MRLRYGLEVRFRNRRDIGHIAEFIESTFFELADSFFGNTESICEFLKGLDSAVAPEGEACPNDELLSAVEPIEHARESSSQGFPADFAHSRGAMFVADVDPRIVDAQGDALPFLLIFHHTAIGVATDDLSCVGAESESKSDVEFVDGSHQGDDSIAQ
jgi:hypothetical protein